MSNPHNTNKKRKGPTTHKKRRRQISVLGFLRLCLFSLLLSASGFLPPATALTTITNHAKDRTGFASWGIYYINQPPIYYAEDYYLLYAQRNYYGEDEINLNIVFMQGALKSPFRPAYKALVPLHTEIQQEKYRSLIRMRCNLRILRDYLALGRLYDMQKLYFFHKEFKDDLIKSLRTARFHYETAEGYWIEVKKHAVEAYLLRDTIVGMPDLEDEMALIVHRDVDWQFDRILRIHLEKVNANIARLEALE